MEQKGRLTLPTDADVVEETLRLKNLLGADALRDCDGTEMPAELLAGSCKEIRYLLYDPQGQRLGGGKPRRGPAGVSYQ